MYGFTAASLTVRAKCFPSSYYLSLSNDRPRCCHSSCCHFCPYCPATSLFPPNHRILCGYFLGHSTLIPSKILLLRGRRRFRVSHRSLDSDGDFSEMMELLEGPVERCRKEVFFGESSCKKGRREVDVELLEGSRWSSRECEVGRRLSRRDGSRSAISSSSFSSGDSKLNEAGRRTNEESVFSYGNMERGSKLSTVDISEEKLGKVRKFVDDSWRERSNSSKGDVLDSRKDESLKGNGSFGGSDRGSQMVKRMVEVQWDESKQTSASTHARKSRNGESSTSAAWKSCNRDAVMGHTELSKNSEFNVQYNDAHCAAHSRRDFNEESSRGREERTYMDQNLSQPRQNEKMHFDKKVHFDKLGAKQGELRRSTNRFSETSVSHGIDFERASNIDDKKITGMDVSSNLVQNSVLVSTDKRAHTGLQVFEENIIKGREGSLSTLDDKVQLRRGERSWIDSRVVKHDDSGRNTQMHSTVLEAQRDHPEATSHLKEVRELGFRSNLVYSPGPVSKDIGTQVDMNDANEELSGLSVNNNIRFSCSRSPPDSRVEPQGYNAPPALKQVSSMTEPLNHENPRGYLQHDKGVDSERDTDVFYYTRGSNRGISSRKETCSSSGENKKGTSTDNESVVLFPEWKDKQGRTPLGETSQSTALQTEPTRSSHGTSSLLYSHREVDNQSSRVDIQQIRNSTSLSKRRYNGSSALHASKANTPEEFVVFNESENAANVSSVNKIQEPGSRNCQQTLRTENQNATSSTMIIQEERERQMFKKESSQSKTVKMASSGGPSVDWSVQTQIEMDNQLNDDAIESAMRFNKSSAMHGDEFVDKVRQEILSMNQSCSTGIQIEEMMQREGQETTSIQIGGLNESRQYGDGRSIKEGRGQCSFGLEMKGPSDEMWDVQGLSSQGPSNIKEVAEESPAKEAMDFSTTTPASENSITRKSHKSLWSFVADIIRMSWVRRGQSHGTTDKRPSSNESLSSEAWYSGPEPDEDATGDDTYDTEKVGLLKKSVPLKDFEESKDEDKLTMGENSPTSSGFLEVASASALSETENIEQAKANAAILSSVGTVEQQFSKEADSAFHYIPKAVESTVGVKSKMLKPSSSYSVGLMTKGFSSRLTQPLDIEHIEDAQVRQDSNSGLQILEQPSVLTDDSALLKVTGIDVANKPGNVIQNMGIDSFDEKLPEGGGNEAEMRRRKLQRNKQVLREQFDDWEEAFKRETDQKNIDEYFMREAILEAKKGADVWEVPVGAVLVQNGKIIARGCNMVEEMRDSTAHAEMICIREASTLLRTWRLAETTLYVTLEPCPMCAGAILQARIDTVVWGAPNRLLGADGSWVRLFPGGDGGSSSMDLPRQMVGPVHPFHPKITIRRGILATECGDVMQQFFKLRRKKEKKHETSPSSSLPVSNRPTRFFAKLHHIFGLMFCL